MAEIPLAAPHSTRAVAASIVVSVFLAFSLFLGGWEGPADALWGWFRTLGFSALVAVPVPLRAALLVAAAAGLCHVGVAGENVRAGARISYAAITLVLLATSSVVCAFYGWFFEPFAVATAALLGFAIGAVFHNRTMCRSESE